jgi:hypothetical protein
MSHRRAKKLRKKLREADIRFEAIGHYRNANGVVLANLERRHYQFLKKGVNNADRQHTT